LRGVLVTHGSDEYKCAVSGGELDVRPWWENAASLAELEMTFS
jgi:hypothetical protein